MGALALAVSLAGCAGLPDQRLANEALKRGDTALAERNYQQLADLGYSEAQVGLADIQVETRDPAKLKQAEATYRAAAQISPRAQARLGRLLVAKPDSSQAERQEAQSLLKKAFAAGEANTLIPLAMLYLQYPQSFPDINAQQQVDQWRAAHLERRRRTGQDVAVGQLKRLHRIADDMRRVGDRPKGLVITLVVARAVGVN